jgi:hypothetical protein
MILDRDLLPVSKRIKEPTTFPSTVKPIPFTSVEEIFYCQPRTQSIRRGGGEILATLSWKMISAIGGQLGPASLKTPPNIVSMKRAVTKTAGRHQGGQLSRLLLRFLVSGHEYLCFRTSGRIGFLSLVVGHAHPN